MSNLLDQAIVDAEALKEAAGKDKIEVKKFIRFKVGVGV